MFGTESADNLFFSVSVSQLGKGLDEQLARFVAEHTDTKLIIIDTLQKVREVGGVILSRLVDTFSSRILYPMLLFSGKHSISVA